MINLFICKGIIVILPFQCAIYSILSYTGLGPRRGETMGTIPAAETRLPPPRRDHVRTGPILMRIVPVVKAKLGSRAIITAKQVTNRKKPFWFGHLSLNPRLISPGHNTQRIHVWAIWWDGMAPTPITSLSNAKISNLIQLTRKISD